MALIITVNALPQTYFQQAQVVHDIAYRYREPSLQTLLNTIVHIGQNPTAAEELWRKVAKADCSVEQLITAASGA
jgi:hypothetical protein